MLVYADTLESSRALTGGLGAVAFAILEGLRQGGAPAEVVSQTEAALNTYLARLTDEDCNTLVQVVETRIAGDKLAEGVWYA